MLSKNPDRQWAAGRSIAGRARRRRRIISLQINLNPRFASPLSARRS